MRLTHWLSGLAVCAGLVFITGCQKQEATPIATQQTNAQTPLPAPTAEVKSTAENVAVAAQSIAGQAATEAQEAVTNVAPETAQQPAGATTQIESLIARAKSLVADKKYEDALNTLRQLSDFKLSPEQQKSVDDLKAEVQKLMSSQGVSDAANAAGNLPKP